MADETCFLLPINCFKFTAVFAQKECLKDAPNLIQTESEKKLLERHSYFLDTYIDCSSETFGIDVFIRESIHAEDLGFTAKDFKENYVNAVNSFSLYSTNGVKKGELLISEFPSPQSIILPFLEKNFPEVLQEESHPLNHYIGTYMKGDAFAATSCTVNMLNLNS